MPPCKTPTLLMRPFFLKYCLHLGHFRDKKTRAKEARRLLRKAARSTVRRSFRSLLTILSFVLHFTCPRFSVPSHVGPITDEGTA